MGADFGISKVFCQPESLHIENTSFAGLTHNVRMAKSKQQWRRTFIKEWRIHKNLNQADLAEAMEISEGYLSSLENGNQRYNQDMLEKASKILDVPAGWLLSKKPPPEDVDIDYSDPYLAVSILEQLPETDKVRIGQIIKTYRDTPRK